ncbi:myb-binding protein 1A-like protein [Anthonomus grandis grandis]|uniref:myb-binding protein 1A-like protein n=1 Tax=Anthonomus grandis grandis TaxID=2921223 RepID=UPI0021665DFD|nr:myb-binding protein 1A-like protein [Anthonomus grandis grandis]
MAAMENPQNGIETEEKPKRKLQKTILDNFSKLSNPHENVRAKSAGNLLKYLVENGEAEQGQNELKYALKRLIRGLGSPIHNARAGYYSTLVALLSLNLDVGARDVLELVKSELHRSGKNSDGENADICVGQILACGAIIKANLWAKADSEQKNEIFQIILTACKERTYLGLFGFSFIIEILSEDPSISSSQEILGKITEEVAKPWSEQSHDSLYLLLKLKSIFPKIFNKKFIKKHLETVDIVCEDSLEKLCSILMALPRITTLKHPLYDTIILDLTPEIVPKFITELDKHLRTPNRNRLLAFMKLLTNILSLVTSDKYYTEVPSLITRNFVTQLLGYFRTFKGKQKDKEYHDAVQKLFETIVAVFSKENTNSDVKISVIKKLLFDPGTFVFEKVTKSKIIQQITLTLDTEGVKNLAKVYRGVVDGTETINSENDSETWLNNDRLYSAHLLIKLLGFPAMKQENDWRVEQLTFLLSVSLLRERSGMNVGRELADSLKSAFFGALNLKLSKLEDVHQVLFKLVQRLDSKLNPENLNDILRTPISSETFQLWKKTMQKVEKIEKKKKKSGVTSVFLTLFLHMSLQLFNEVKLATESLNELFSCYDRVKKDKKLKHTLDNTTLDNTLAESENDPHWIEVVTDLFLNLLSHNSSLLRSIINSVFPHLCGFMTSATIHQILNVLDPKTDENPLSKDDGSSSESENEHSDSESENESEEDVDDEGEEEEEDDEDEEDVSDETANDKLRMALHQALSNGATQSDDESIDLDQMSDTEGEKLDKALADAFRQFKPNHGKRKKQTKDQETLTHFRVRVLDLIEIYLDSTPSMLLSLEIMLPLLQAVEFSIRDEHQKPLNDRLKHILKKLLGLKKYSDVEGVTDSTLVELLKSLLDKGSKNALIVQEMGEQIADCCIFVVKCSEILRNHEGTPAKVKKHLKSHILEVISGEIHQFFTKRECLTPYVLLKNLMQLTWEGNIGLAMVLLDFMFSSEIRKYKKNQVAELLKIFYSNQRFFSQMKTKINSKMSEAHTQFGSTVVEFFKELCNDPDKKNIKERFICNIFNLLTAMRQNGSLESTLMPWQDIAHNIREYRSYKSFSKDAKLAFNKLCKALGVSNTVAMKPQVTKLATLIDDEEAEVVSDEVPKQKPEKKKSKKKSKETLKLKKEAKQLRLSSLSKGLGEVEFEDVGDEVEPDDLDDAESEVKKTKKPKETDTEDCEVNKSVKKKRRSSTTEEVLNGSVDSISNKKLKKNGISEEEEHNSISNTIINKKRRMSEGAPLVKRKRKNSF